LHGTVAEFGNAKQIGKVINSPDAHEHIANRGTHSQKMQLIRNPQLAKKVLPHLAYDANDKQRDAIIKHHDLSGNDPHINLTKRLISMSGTNEHRRILADKYGYKNKDN
jgi:hypothetical protein